MSYRKISATEIHTVSGVILRDQILIIDSQGKIMDIQKSADVDHTEIEFYKGAIVPGFINAHCHLELSHLKGIIPSGTGLIPFIEAVVKLREFPMEEIIDAMQRADEEMYREGIMAVGDISNKTDSIQIKSKSKLTYYTFVEFFDLMQPSLTEKTYSQYLEAYNAFQATPNLKSAPVPHAPYSVSPELFKNLRNIQKEGSIISIHNQETPDENLMFQKGEGALYDFYKSLGLDLSHFVPEGCQSIEYAMRHMNPQLKTLFVHNTMTTSEDIALAQSWNPLTFWVTCPNANLYIENRLGTYSHLLKADAKICIGTDSLSSNWRLSILHEMKTILKYQSSLTFEKVLQWATLNGAEALGLDANLGSIEIGKSPGLVLIDYNDEAVFSEKSSAKRLC
jgi:aminodeoxyfutalosine deaminase